MPYISTTPAKLRNPCTGDQNCTTPFSYRNVLNLTSEGNRFNELVGAQQISGNLDSPEGGFDAIMQVAVCGVSRYHFLYCCITSKCFNGVICIIGLEFKRKFSIFHFNTKHFETSPW